MLFLFHSFRNRQRMHGAFVLLPWLVLGKISGTKNRFVPDCESGDFDVASIDEFDQFLNEENHFWKPSLNHQWGGNTITVMDLDFR